MLGVCRLAAENTRILLAPGWCAGARRACTHPSAQKAACTHSCIPTFTHTHTRTDTQAHSRTCMHFAQQASPAHLANLSQVVPSSDAPTSPSPPLQPLPRVCLPTRHVPAAPPPPCGACSHRCHRKCARHTCRRLLLLLRLPHACTGGGGAILVGGAQRGRALGGCHGKLQLLALIRTAKAQGLAGLPTCMCVFVCLSACVWPYVCAWCACASQRGH